MGTSNIGKKCILLFCSISLLFLASGQDILGLNTPKMHQYAYDPMLARTLAEYAAVVYLEDANSLLAWNCSRCHDLTEGFKMVQLIVDVKNWLQAFVGIAEDLNAIVIAFRGTLEKSIQNWMTDLYFAELEFKYPGLSGALVHSGFYHSYHNTSLRPRITAAVENILKERNLTIIVTGHSMGGAIASFCALDLVINYGLEDTQLVTFGQPRVGNPTFAAFFNVLVPRTTRVTHDHDLVPHIPPYLPLLAPRTYHHFAREVWITGVPIGLLYLEYERVCDGSGEDPTCSSSVAGNSITDHFYYFGVYMASY